MFGGWGRGQGCVPWRGRRSAHTRQRTRQRVSGLHLMPHGPPPAHVDTNAHLPLVDLLLLLTPHKRQARAVVGDDIRLVVDL